MSKEVNDKEYDQLPWYVLRHLNPSWIESMLQKDSHGRFLKDDAAPLPPYRFFIPFQTMPRIIADSQPKGRVVDDRPYDPVKDESSLRGDLRSFVFIQAPAWRVDAIVKSEWNTRTRLTLTYYRDTDRSLVTVPDSDMHRLIRTLQDRQLRFYLDQPVDDFSVGDKVVLHMEPWEGKTAEIRKIVFRQDRVKLTVSLNIFGRTKSITFPDIAVGDVHFLDQSRGRLLSGNPITNYEEEIIDLLSHRYTQKHTEDVEELDRQRLKRLATYSNIYVEDPDEQARYLALKLICAYLRNDTSRVRKYQEEVEQMLSPSTLHPSPSTLHLFIALFITTRNPVYRDAVKAYRQAHPDSPDVLRRYHSIVKGLKPKKPKKPLP